MIYSRYWKDCNLGAGIKNWKTELSPPFAKSRADSQHQRDMGPHAEGSGAGGAVEYALRFDRKHKVLLIIFGKVATQASALSTYAAVERVVGVEGPCSVIADLSAVEKVEVTGDFVCSIAWMPHVIPAGKLRIIVAPRTEIYGLSRMFQLYRGTKSSDVHVVHTLEEAHNLLGLESLSFESVDSK